MAGHPRSPLAAAATAVAAAMAVLSILSPAAAAEGPGLTPDYYSQSCPKLEEIVSGVVTNKQIAQPSTAAASLRLFFHDCFAGGCDGSVLISSNSFNPEAERDADLNHSLPGDGFDVVIRSKAALELACPDTVSCADILALTTRDLVSMVGGPFYPLRYGRKDSLTSTAASVAGNLPRSNMSVDALIALFATRGFTAGEMVALSGAHTVGFAHCVEFADRIFSYKGGPPAAFDPAMNPRYAQALQKACADYKNDTTMAAFNDVMTPGKFDNMYFKNLGRGLGLLASDAAIAGHLTTAPIVKLYADNQTAFFEDFAKAMQKVSEYKVLTGGDGEVRRNCDKFNNVSA